MTFLTVLVAFGLVWLVAMEIRLHGLKNVAAEATQVAEESAAETKQLAEEAVAYAQALLRKNHLHVDSPPPPATKPKAKR